MTIGDFWSWAYSDVLSTRDRALLAEYAVGLALRCLDRPRAEWDRGILWYRGHPVLVTLHPAPLDRTAACQVMCVTPEDDPLDLRQWRFYAVSPARMRVPPVSLWRLRKVARELRFDQLRDAVDSALDDAPLAAMAGA